MPARPSSPSSFPLLFSRPGAAPSLRSLGCAFRRVRRYNPDEGALLPRKHALAAEVGSDREAHPKKEEAPLPLPQKASVPFFGVQVVGGGTLTASQILSSLRRKAAPPLPAADPPAPAGGRPAWDSSLPGSKPPTKAALRGSAGCIDDVAAVRVCGVGGGFAPPGCAPSAPQPAGAPAGGAGGCGGRIRDIMSKSARLRPQGGEEGQGGAPPPEERSALRILLERVSPPKEAGASRTCLISRFEPSGGRLFVCDRARAARRAWLEQSDLLNGRAVRCIRQQAALGEYPQMRHAWYEVDDVLNEPILGYHTDEVGSLLEVAGVRRLQIKQVMGYIHEGISRGEGVLVHCRQGANRSATVAAAYMMIYHRFSCEDALRLIEVRGPTPNVVRQPGFTRQLLLLEQELAAARASVDVRRCEDLPGEWGDVMFALGGCASEGSTFITAKLRSQLEGGGAPMKEDELQGKEKETEKERGGGLGGGQEAGGRQKRGGEEGVLEMRMTYVPETGGGLSCIGEVLEGQIWHSKLLSIEEGRGLDAGEGVLCIAPPPLSNADSTVTDLVMRLAGAALEAVGEREVEVRPLRRPAMRITLKSSAERDEFVRAAAEMTATVGVEVNGEEGDAAWECATKAHLVVNEEEEEEVWM